jgi:hypothetical protein
LFPWSYSALPWLGETGLEFDHTWEELMSGQQLTLDLELVALPQPEVTHAKILNSDIPVGDQPLQIANHLKHGLVVLGAVQALSPDKLTPQIHAPVRIGYGEIEAKIHQVYGGLRRPKSSIALTVDALVDLGLLKMLTGPVVAASGEYQALTTPGITAMLAGLGVTHIRITRGQLELIAAI